MNRTKARQFIHTVEWCLPRHLMYLFEGKYNSESYGYYRKELVQMSQTKRVEPLRVIRGAVTAFCDPQSKKHRLPWIANHDSKIRDFMARWFYLYGGMETAGYDDEGADFKINDNLFFELDNGSMDKKALKNKLERHYTKEGKFQVIFAMSSQYGAANEYKRLKLLFEVVKEVLPGKPNRVLGVCFSEFFNGKSPMNYKGVSQKL